VGLVVQKTALGQIISEYFGSPANHLSTNLSIIILSRDGHNRPISGRSAEWTNWTPPPLYQFKKKKYLFIGILIWSYFGTSFF
jgi:hypothetical protein